MTLTDFLHAVPKGAMPFTETMAVIASNYNYSPTGFYNGIGDAKFYNAAGTNEGSCKLFAFAKENGLDMQATLHCFGEFYTVDVLQHPEGTDHQNIRTFMQCGWEGIVFDDMPLSLIND